MTIDFGLTANDYARHRAGFPESFFERVAAYGVVLHGQAVVDLGTGTGTLARNFARRGCVVTGIDPAANMLEQAKQLSVAEGVTIDYRLATAEADWSSRRVSRCGERGAMLALVRWECGGKGMLSTAASRWQGRDRPLRLDTAERECSRGD